MIPRQGEQSPVVIISYMGYSPPKCTCMAKQTHSSNYMNLLKCQHDRSRVPSPHRLSHTCLSQYANKIISFQNKSFLFLKTDYRVSVKVLDYPPRRMCWRTFLNISWAPPACNCWTISQHHSPENHPWKFLSKTFSFSFQFHVMHSHLITRLPRCI